MVLRTLVAFALLACVHSFCVGPTCRRQQLAARHRSSSVSLNQEREIKLIEDTDAYHALIEAATNENRLVVIKFYASWCRACKAMAPKFQRVADDAPPEMEFYEILFDNNKKLCKSLGIKILPFIEIVAGSKGKIEGFTCGPSKISLLMGKVEELAADSCDLNDPECTDITNQY